jgi:ribosomal protein S18 acetylase RimI-like enzyme
MKLGTIALNVREDNAPAIRVYERLGFDDTADLSRPLR